MRRILMVLAFAIGSLALAGCGGASGDPRGDGATPSSNWNELVWSEGSWSG